MRKCYRSSIIAASWMIVFAFTFDQGLTQTEIALCLSVIDDLHISVRHLRRRLSGLQLYRRRQYSDPECVVTCSQIQFPRGCPSLSMQRYPYLLQEISNFMMEISAASAYTIIFARNIHKVRDFLVIATITSKENGFYVEIHNFRYVEITTKQLSLCRDHEKIKS